MHQAKAVKDAVRRHVAGVVEHVLDAQPTRLEQLREEVRVGKVHRRRDRSQRAHRRLGEARAKQERKNAAKDVLCQPPVRVAVGGVG
jgi:hypothetical protein